MSIQPQPESGEATPALSIVLATPDVFATVALTMSHLRVQTVIERIELIVVAPDLETLDMPEGLVENFAAVQFIECGHGLLLCEIKARGALSATGNVIVFAEDHCFPAPDWAHHLIESHKQDCAAAGPLFHNANPRTSLSWLDYLLNFGTWSLRDKSEVMDGLAWHNTSYKRELLVAYGDKLGSVLATEGLLMEDLKKRGHKLYFSSGAQVYHLNTSRPLELVQGFFYSGRLFGALRSRSWTPLRRGVQILASPVVVWLRFPNQLEDLRRNRAAGVIPDGVKMWAPMLLVVSALHILGEAVGCAFGTGDTMRRKSDAESHRLRRLAKVDQRDIEQREQAIAVLLNSRQPVSAVSAE